MAQAVKVEVMTGSTPDPSRVHAYASMCEALNTVLRFTFEDLEDLQTIHAEYLEQAEEFANE